MSKKLLYCDAKKLTPIFKKYGVKSAYLFGSRVSGKTHAGSDTDVAVRFSKKISLKNLLILANDLGKHLPPPVQVIDLDQAPLPLQFRVYRSRCLLFAEHPKEEVRKRTADLCLYYDYQYYFDRFTEFETKRIVKEGVM